MPDLLLIIFGAKLSSQLAADRACSGLPDLSQTPYNAFTVRAESDSTLGKTHNVD